MRDVTLRIAAIERDEVTLTVLNGSTADIVLLSPHAPSRQMDEGGCELRLSSKIDRNIRPFAFTPELVTIAAGKETIFRATLAPVSLVESCATWTVSADYAYLKRDEVESFKKRTSHEFWEYAIDHQRIVNGSGKATPPK
ncbi:MAG: hypothetical protein ABI779_27180 [Acidobacteriota bacterium]